MMARPYHSAYQNKYCTGVKTKNDQNSVRWSAGTGLMRLIYSRNASMEIKPNRNMDPPVPTTKDSAKITTMIHQERVRAFMFATVALPLSDLTVRAKTNPVKLASDSPPNTPTAIHIIW